MKKTFFVIAIAFSLSASAQGTSVKDTASIRKEQEAANKFVIELVSKTSIKDFQQWVYENLPAKKNDEFVQLFNYFIQQKYLQSKEQPKK
jgi:hypothetical protein